MPICSELPFPRMPKFALANDLWIGKLPSCLSRMTKGARILLPLVRGMIRRFNCSFDSKTGFVPANERIKGYVGNTVAFPQGDGGALVASLPPQTSEVAKRLAIAFVGSDEDLARAYMPELGVDFESFKAAYDWLREHNDLYATVAWLSLIHI